MIAAEQRIAPPSAAGREWLFDAYYQPISLLAVLKFNAHSFVSIFSTLGQMVQMLNVPATLISDESWDQMASAIATLGNDAIELGLTVTVAQIERLKKDIRSSTPMKLETMKRRLATIQETAADELESRVVLALMPGKADYYNETQFPDLVQQHFSSAVFDMREAGKCFALNRNTACVFHLMRVMEAGLRALGKKCKVTESHNPSWDTILRKIDSQLQTKRLQRAVWWKGSNDFLAEASAKLHAVKDAWRNPTMHVGAKHTEEEAQEIFDAVRGFMRHLATKLNER